MKNSLVRIGCDEGEWVKSADRSDLGLFASIKEKSCFPSRAEPDLDHVQGGRSLSFVSFRSRTGASPSYGKALVLDQKGHRCWSPKSSRNFSIHAQALICVSQNMRWWEKTLKPNMTKLKNCSRDLQRWSKRLDRERTKAIKEKSKLLEQFQQNEDPSSMSSQKQL